MHNSFFTIWRWASWSTFIPVKLPWIFPGASLTYSGAPGNIQGNLIDMNIVSGKGMSPVGRQAITWNSAHLLLAFSPKNMPLKISSAKRRPVCSSSLCYTLPVISHRYSRWKTVIALRYPTSPSSSRVVWSSPSSPNRCPTTHKNVVSTCLALAWGCHVGMSGSLIVWWPARHNRTPIVSVMCHDWMRWWTESWPHCAKVIPVFNRRISQIP